MTPRVVERNGVGAALVRLRDVPFEVRREALEGLLKRGEVKTPQEAEKLFRLVLEPGDAGERIAA